ncbi:MAG: DUF4982 domain-containing protein [Colwellia sp.]
MRLTHHLNSVAFKVLLLIISLSAFHAKAREVIDLNNNWQFALGHATDSSKDFNFDTSYFSYRAKTGFGDGAAYPKFDDRGWQTINLPHDWAVALPFDKKASHSHGYKTIGPNYPQTSIGWYRKTITIADDALGKRIFLEFDGIYRDAKIFVNGFFIGSESSGYMLQRYDISEYLNYGGDNVIAVRADASKEEGWYYEGAGIYRDARLVTLNPVHVQQFGTFIKSTVNAHSSNTSTADLAISTQIVNTANKVNKIKVSQQVFDQQNKLVTTAPVQALTLQVGQEQQQDIELNLNSPILWDLDNPHLYTLVTTLTDSKGKQLDSYRTSFGVRTIKFDPNKGFFLNGKHIVLKGSNNHQDHAGVGVATSDALNEYRLKRLKDMGGNAYRASHHPASPALLALSDRLGILVIDENRLMGVNKFHIDQLEQLIKRGRNHPSIVLWSLGNEEWGIESNIKGARITEHMQNIARRLDPTRLNTVAISGGWGGIDQTVEVMGVNYIKHGSTDAQHKKNPWQVILGTEETTTQATRGIYIENAAKAHLAPLENGSSGGNAESGWQHYADREYLAGIFYWTGFDYRGEPTPYGFPGVLSQFGILDNCGFAKDSFYYLKSWWGNEPVLHTFPHWTWPDRVGEIIDVRVHSNYPQVELLLNDKSLGIQDMPNNGHLAWQVPYQAGTLITRGYQNGKVVEERSMSTVSSLDKLKLVPSKTAFNKGDRDTIVVDISAIADTGGVHLLANNNIEFSLSGPATILGVGNGDPSSLAPEQFLASTSTMKLGKWTAPLAQDTQSAVKFSVTFDQPELTNNQQARLLLSTLGDNQTLMINGTTVPMEDGEFYLADLKLKKKNNQLVITATPFKDWGARENIARVHPAIIAITTLAKPYQRKLFNGHAQLIIETSGVAGVVILQTKVSGLKTQTLTLTAK